MTDILLYTTSAVEKIPIEKYFGIISANQVAGTGFFTDLTASVSDFFGGHSGAYRESMNELYSDVVKQIKEKARELGANAIVGVRIDYNNIPAKGMSMFMVSIYGTAVKLQIQDEEDIASLPNEISLEVLNQEYCKDLILHKLEEGKNLDKDDWTFALKNAGACLIEPLYNYYLKCKKEAKIPCDSTSAGPDIRTLAPQWAIEGIKNFKSFVGNLNYKDAIELVYEDVPYFKDLINSNKLFNARKIEEIAANGQLDLAIALLSVEKTSYNEIDLTEMKSLSTYLLNLPDVGKKEDIKGGLFSSGGLKFVCSCGTKNDPEIEFCTQCGKNMQGVTKEQKEQIERFVELTNTLSRLIK